MTEPLVEMRACLYCISGLHDECADPEEVEENKLRCCCARKPISIESDDEPGAVGRPMLPPDKITDITSTGRKRAAMLYPIFTGQVCEWAGLKYAGGGIEPIIGCSGNTLADVKRNADLPEGIDSRGDRHHGPDKNVLNNEPGNVHRICSQCHNRYHAKNNRYYTEPRPPAGEPWLPDPKFGECKKHDPDTKATDEERAEDELRWGKKNLTAVDTRD